MGKLVDKVKGNINEAAGKVKQESADPFATKDAVRN